MITTFLARLAAADLQPSERFITCTFRGDPGAAPINAWKPHPWRPGEDVVARAGANGYVTVSTFVRAADNTFRRRTEGFASGRALMVDDVGTKVAHEAVQGMRPTMRVETSPGNEQWWYVLGEPERDAARFDAVIRAFIAGKLLGADPGMAGVNRVGRIPGFINGKPQHNGWRCELRDADGPTWSLDELVEGFELKLMGRAVARERRLAPDDAEERIRAWAQTTGWLRSVGALKRHEPDRSGWIEMRCPWVDHHTNGIDNGAAVREPAAENDYNGAFRCFHGHCTNKGWRHLTEWANEQQAATLDAINARAILS